MKVIINADDFGYSSDVNRAILDAIKNGLISSTTLMVNMPGFNEAVIMAKGQDFIDRVGIHLNLFEGKPLTKEMQECSHFCDENGIFHGKYENGIFYGNKIKLFDPFRINSNVIYNELYTQIDKAVSAGIRPTHLDSHGNKHANYFIGSIVIKLAKQFNIPSIRINSNLRTRENIFSQMAVILYNLRLKWHGIKCVGYLGTISEITPALLKLIGTVEIVVHPVYINGFLVDYEFETEASHLLTQFQEFEKISYAEL